jgi:8-oxo-dGTP pyrophosphatase MutT (NUDIX family)
MMAREISAGGVVVRRMRDRWWIAAIEPQSSSTRRAQQKRPTVALPKGLVDEGESPEQTAVREVREETGVVAEQIVKLKDIRYVYVRSWGDRQRVFKIVSFYLLRYMGGKIGEITAEMRKEVRSAEWIPLEEAPQRLTYPGEREVAQLAADYISAHPEDVAPAAGPKRTEV